ncbi:MAG: aminodeoxychorismate/anthranilate synthase component II [Conexivisphaerales archaeon]|nr:aminodeoxychorismate/anthranilate synthase component II [Conexivisphaerales archaeon]
MSDLTLIIDNYDSFVYNIAQYVGELGSTAIVVRNDEISVKAVERINPDRIIISPGPGSPERKEDSGIVIDLIRVIGRRVPLLGICFGHQAIGVAYGAKMKSAKKIMHGKIDKIRHLSNSPIYQGINSEFTATRYHSLVLYDVIDPLEVDAISLDDNEIMGIHHKEYRIYGTQFHPESIGTSVGKKILYNFFNKV